MSKIAAYKVAGNWPAFNKWLKEATDPELERVIKELKNQLVHVKDATPYKDGANQFMAYAHDMDKKIKSIYSEQTRRLAVQSRTENKTIDILWNSKIPDIKSTNKVPDTARDGRTEDSPYADASLEYLFMRRKMCRESPSDASNQCLLLISNELIKRGRTLKVFTSSDPFVSLYVKKTYPLSHPGRARGKDMRTEDIVADFHLVGYRMAGGGKIETSELSMVAKELGLPLRTTKRTKEQIKRENKAETRQEKVKEVVYRAATTVIEKDAVLPQYRVSDFTRTGMPAPIPTSAPNSSLFDVLLDTIPAETLGSVLKELRKKGAI